MAQNQTAEEGGYNYKHSYNEKHTLMVKLYTGNNLGPQREKWIETHLRLKPIEIADLEKVVSKVEDMRPYKESGNRESYSEYNEGWSDACDVLWQALLSKLTQQ